MSTAARATTKYSLNLAISSVEAVVMWWDQLDIHLVGLDVLLNCLGALVVHHIQFWLVIASTEYCKHFGEGSNEQGIGAGWHWPHNDCIEVIDIGNKDIFPVLKRPNGKSTSDVSVHRAGRGIGKGGKSKHILDHAGFVRWAHTINFGPGKDNVGMIIAC